MDDTGFFNAEFNCTALGSLNSTGNINSHSTDFRVWHHAARAENLTQTTNEWHHVRGSNAAIEIDIAGIDGFEQVFRTNDIRTGFLSFFSFVTTGKYSNANSTTCTVWQINNAANHLVSMTWIYTEIHRNFDSFVEFRNSTFLYETKSSAQVVKFHRLYAFTDFSDTL